MKLIIDEEIIEEKLSEFAERIISEKKVQPVSEWISEKKASEILGYSNLQHLRKIVQDNNIKFSKRGKRLYYSIDSINEYIENGVVKIY